MLLLAAAIRAAAQMLWDQPADSQYEPNKTEPYDQSTDRHCPLPCHPPHQFLYTGSGGRDLSGNKRTNKEQSFDQVGLSWWARGWTR